MTNAATIQKHFRHLQNCFYDIEQMREFEREESYILTFSQNNKNKSIEIFEFELRFDITYYGELLDVCLDLKIYDFANIIVTKLFETNKDRILKLIDEYLEQYSKMKH